MNFEDLDTAQQVRDIIKQVAKQIVAQDAPKPQFGRVISVNFVAMTATVWFPGDDAPVTVRLLSSVLPGTWQEKFGLGSGAGIISDSFSGYGSMVTVENFNGKQYIAQVLNGGQFSIDYEMAGSLQIEYDTEGNPGNPGTAEYTYSTIWDTFGDNVTPALPNRGGPYAINIGPFLNAFSDVPAHGVFEVDLIAGTGMIQSYKFNFSPYAQMTENNFSGIYNRWFRVMPSSVDELDKSANSNRVVNGQTNFFDAGVVGDWTVGTNTVQAQSFLFTNSGGGSLSIWSSNGTQAIIQSNTDTTKKYSVVPGATYSYRADVMSTILWASGARMSVDWYTSAGAFISSSDGSGTGSLAANTWVTTPTFTATAPVTAVFGVWKIQVLGTPAINQKYYWDNINVKTADPVTKTEFNLDVALRQTAHGAISGIPVESPGEMWIRIYIDFMDAIQNPVWHVRIHNTGSFAQAKSTQTGKPVYEFDTSPVDAVGYLGYHDSNAGYTTNATQYILGQFGQWSTGPWRNPDLNLASRAQEVLSGGGIITWDGSLLKWSAPFEIGGIGRSRNGLALGKAQLSMPTSGVIPIFPGGTQTATLTGTGIPLVAGQALYFGIPPGIGATIPSGAWFNGGLHGAGGLFIVDSSSPYWWSVPEWAVLIAYCGSDNTQPEIKLGTGAWLDKWRLITLANSWTNSGTTTIPAYRKITGDLLHIVGEATAGTVSDNTTIGTLPSGFRPLFHRAPLSVAKNPVTAGTMTPLLMLNTDGTLVCFGMTAACTIYFDVQVPLSSP